MGDLRPPLNPMFSAFGVSAVVTPAGGAPVDADVIFDTLDPAKLSMLGGEFGEIADLRPTVAIRRADIASLPVGSTIVAARGGESSRTWTVDRLVEARGADPELHIVLVH